jgi:hypothetical protein
MTTQRSRRLAAHPGSPPTGDSRVHPANPGRPRGRPSHCPTTSHDGQVQPDPSADPARPAPASTARFRPQPTTNWPWIRQATTPTTAIPATRLPAHRHPSTTSRPTTVDAGTHGHRTPTPDTGRRTSGRSDAAPDTGQRPPGQARVMLNTRTRHWTPDADRGHRHADEGTAGIRTPWATMPSGRALGHPTVFLWTTPAALGNHDGSAVGHLPARDCLPHDQPAARSLRRPNRASAHCSPPRISGRA